MKTIIFDLKDTLVDPTGILQLSTKRLLDQVITSKSCKTVLYSMNEAWTYEVLARYTSLLTRFDVILLVSEKKLEDLSTIMSMPADCLVVGDSEAEELAFGTTLGIQTVNVKTSERPFEQVIAWLGK